MQKQYAYIMSKKLHHINEQPAFFSTRGGFTSVPLFAAGGFAAAGFAAAGFAAAGFGLERCGPLRVVPWDFAAGVSLFLSKLFKASCTRGSI